MRSALLAATLIAALAAHAEDPQGAWVVVNGPQGTVKTSLFSEEHATLPVAAVESAVVTLGDLSRAIATSHSAHGVTGDSKPLRGGKKDYTPVLNRLIGLKLICLEAHDMGLDEAPDVQTELARFYQSGLREGLKARLTKDVVADPAEVERMYKDSVREWKVRSLLFTSADDAKAFAKAPGTWDDAARAAVAAKKAKGGVETQLISQTRKALPQVLEAVQALKPGGTSAPIRVDKGFAVVHVDAITYPDDARKRQEAEDYSLKRRQSEVLMKVYSDLVKKTAKIDEKLLKKLDLEAKKPGFDKLLKDKRVLAKVEGAKDVTVGDLAAAINEEFFHGIKQAIASKKVNARKVPVFNMVLYGTIFDAEAKRQGIPDTPEFRKAISDQRDALVFGKFVEKVVAPDVKLTEEDGKKYYEEHKADYTYPAFYTLSSIAFESAKAAQSALEKLKGGTDFRWLKSNAAGQLAEEKRDVEFDGTTVSARGVPAELATLLSGARPGDLRIYAARDGGHYLIQVKAVQPPAPQPYAEARADIAPKLQRIKMNQAVDDWIVKLRKARPVKVYITELHS